MPKRKENRTKAFALLTLADGRRVTVNWSGDGAEITRESAGVIGFEIGQRIGRALQKAVGKKAKEPAPPPA